MENRYFFLSIFIIIDTTTMTPKRIEMNKSTQRKF